MSQECLYQDTDMTGYAKDIFISYAHIDNQPLTPGESGWITQLHSTLKAILDTRLGHPAQIWRDEKLQGNDVFSDEIMAQFSDTAVLLSVLTPRYLKSEWCTREMSEFCETAEQSGGVVLDNKARIFKVLKTPVETEETLPPVAKDVLGYEFFTYDNEVPLELDAAYGEQFGQAYNRKVAQLAFDLSQLLTKLESEKGADNSDTEDDKPVVYLAECSYDQREAREILEADLKSHGYKILPDRQLPRDEFDYVKSVQSLLEQCTFSIHLVGNTYGLVPDGPSQKSETVLQNELAVQQCADGNPAFKRIIWLPDGTQSDQSRQQSFIDSIHRDAQVQFGADLVTADLETLKASMHTALKQMEQPEQASSNPDSAAAENNKLIYLICNEKDRKATVPLRKYCREQGYDVAIPAFEGDAAAVRHHHMQLGSQCDGVLLYYGAGDEAWKRTFDIELKKLPGYRSDKPLLASFTYLASPRTADKEDLVDMGEPDLIEGVDEFPLESIDQFLQLLNENGEAV